MIRLDKINLPVFAIGAGVIHAIGLAVLLPLLITLPGPGSDIDPHAVAIDVDIVPASRPSPKVDGDIDQTSALPAATEPDEAPAPSPMSAPRSCPRCLRKSKSPSRKKMSPQRLRRPRPSQRPSRQSSRELRPRSRVWPASSRQRRRSGARSRPRRRVSLPSRGRGARFSAAPPLHLPSRRRDSVEHCGARRFACTY